MENKYIYKSVNKTITNKLESKYRKGIMATGREFTLNSSLAMNNLWAFSEEKYREFEFNGKRYVRVKSYRLTKNAEFKLSNRTKYNGGDDV